MHSKGINMQDSQDDNSGARSQPHRLGAARHSLLGEKKCKHTHMRIQARFLSLNLGLKGLMLLLIL